MTLSNKTEKEAAVYQIDTFKDLNIPEALAIIAVFAAQMFPDYCEREFVQKTIEKFTG
jgi:hypothetical protein